MCGIAAVFGAPEERAALWVRMMLARIHHRGYSKDELWHSAESGAALGANRLEIVDPARGHQPAQNEDGTIVVVLNGEIYNHGELKGQLESLNHRFRTDCDTEVIVHAYEQWGEDVCDRLRGMFAFVLYDCHLGRVLLARDPVGVKPLYFGEGCAGQLFVASEAKAFPGLVDRIQLLSPGHTTNGVVKPTAYRTSEADSRPVSFSAASQELAAVLEEAVAIRIPQKMSFAVFLSGGLDSSLILALAARHRPDVIAISGGFPGSAELMWAKQLCAILGVRHEVVEFSFDELTSNYERVINHLESYEPNLVRAGLVTYAICQRAQRIGLKVAMAGEGADEQFAGYKEFEDLPLDSLAASLDALFSDLHRTQLMRWDKIGMAHTLEVRTPFMDRKVVALSRRIPLSYKLRPRKGKRQPETKAILREAARGLVPDATRIRDKIPMDEGVTPRGRQHWNQLLKRYAANRPVPQLSASILSDFSIRSLEEMLNLSILKRLLPMDFIARDRIRVRSSL